MGGGITDKEIEYATLRATQPFVYCKGRFLGGGGVYERSEWLYPLVILIVRSLMWNSFLFYPLEVEVN